LAFSTNKHTWDAVDNNRPCLISVWLQGRGHWLLSARLLSTRLSSSAYKC